jgi:DNA-binding transcriptional regulator YdaS (Cro superfamily)
MQEETPPKVALRKASKVIGGQAALAAALGYADRRNVNPWFTMERNFPAEHCPVVERLTREKASEAGDPSLVVTCEELRPDVAWDVLRESPQEAA